MWFQPSPVSRPGDSFLLASIRNVPIWLRGSCCHMHRNMLTLEFNTEHV